jgi:UDP-glucuronate 4-epimerase
MKKNKILITGACGFIGFHLTNLFIDNGDQVTGIDNLRKTYDPTFKKKRLSLLKKRKNFIFSKTDLTKLGQFKNKHYDLIIHLAGEAGVRDSIKRPNYYIQENLQNTVNVFEYAKKNKINNIFYASSSSVYGNCNTYPSKENLIINKPLSVYGLSKSACELLAYYYSNIFGINSIGLRFFTVYGPIGRPDMSMNIFINNILNNKKITLYNSGKNFRDYTYVDDITNYIYSCFKAIKKKKNYFEILNIGGENSIRIDKLLVMIEKILKKKTKVVYETRNKLDPIKSLADNKKIKIFTGKKFNTPLAVGVEKCISSRFKEGL